MIKYHHAPDIEDRAKSIGQKVGIMHDFSRIKFVRSTGSQATCTLARCHAFPRVLQAALGMKAHYVIEVISEQFDRMSEEQQTKTIIHELMHIPKSMGGGFRHHDYVCSKNIERMYRMLREN